MRKKKQSINDKRKCQLIMWHFLVVETKKTDEELLEVMGAIIAKVKNIPMDQLVIKVCHHFGCKDTDEEIKSRYLQYCFSEDMSEDLKSMIKKIKKGNSK